jgi:uncharacterized protein YcfJ
MVKGIFTTLALCLGLATSANAGCLSGAVAGGVVGHMAGHHGLAGAAVGCAIGHHSAKVKQDRQANQNNQTDPSSQTK